MDSILKVVSVIFLLILIGMSPCFAQQSTYPPSVRAESEQKQNPIIKHLRQLTEIIGQVIPERKDANAPERLLPKRIRHAVTEEQVSLLTLPKDTTRRLNVKEIRITGNTLVSTKDLLDGVPLVYNASETPLAKAQPEDIYDLRNIRDVIAQPGQSVEVSLRTIQGFTQYILSAYQDNHYSGIYVYVPKATIKNDTSLVDDILQINVIEATVSDITTKFYNIERNEKEKGTLRRSALEKWMPVREGQVTNQKSLDNTLNLLNEDPDRYITALVSPGSEPNTLDVQYNVYETNPWHYFIQVDNSGTEDRQWNPRVGLINTNFLGFDDRLTVIGQGIPDTTIDENYSLYGSYDFPVAGPRLRLNVYGGYSKYDINPGTGPFNFIGRGDFYGAVMRYNVLQRKGWFFDVTGSLSREESKIKPSLFPQFLSSHVKMDLFGVGFNIHRDKDMSSTSFAVNKIQNIGGSDQSSFWNPFTITGARMNAERDFAIYTVSGNHSQFLDKRKVQQIRSTFRWIRPTERLVPAKMTSFGGMYSVRGYEEYEIIADGGFLASVQYEFDLVRHNEAIEQQSIANQEIRKLAPLIFFDYGRSRIEAPVPGEKWRQTIYSVGTGIAAEFGKYFSGAIYFGYPLKSTPDTAEGECRINISLMLRR
jgi:hemolysin activation/secretion protein